MSWPACMDIGVDCEFDEATGDCPCKNPPPDPGPPHVHDVIRDLADYNPETHP